MTLPPLACKTLPPRGELERGFLCDLRLRQNLRSVLAGSPYKRKQEERPLYLCVSVVRSIEEEIREEQRQRREERARGAVSYEEYQRMKKQGLLNP